MNITDIIALAVIAITVVGIAYLISNDKGFTW